MKKRIMHIVQCPGGVERYIKMFLNNINLSEYENIMVCSFDYKEEDYRDTTIAFEHVDMIRNIEFKSDLKAIFKVRKLIKNYNPDVLYMHSSKAGAIGRLANFGFKNLSIYNPHGWAFNIECSKKKKIVYKLIERILSPLSNIIIAISDFEKESAIKCKICKEDKIKVIYNGIDIVEFKKQSENLKISKELLGIPMDSYVIGTIGRLSKQKAPDTFIKVAARIKEKIPNVYFIMVGDGEEYEEVKRLISKYNLVNNILITGWTDKPIEYLQVFDQAMLLSRWEGFGLVLAEYMLARKPIVATNVDAIPNLIINGVNGLLVSKDDLSEIADASTELIRNKKLNEHLVEQGYKVAINKFDINRVILEFCKLIN